MKKVLCCLVVAFVIFPVVFAAELQLSLAQRWEQVILPPLKAHFDQNFEKRWQGNSQYSSLDQDAQQALQHELQILVASEEMSFEEKISCLNRMEGYLQFYEGNEALARCWLQGLINLITGYQSSQDKAKALVYAMKKGSTNYITVFMDLAFSLLQEDAVEVYDKGFLWYAFISHLKPEHQNKIPNNVVPQPGDEQNLITFARGALKAEEITLHFERRYDVWRGLDDVAHLRAKADELHQLDHVLWHVAADGDIEKIIEEFEKGGDINAKRHSWQLTPLIQLLCFNYNKDNLVQIVTELLARGADVNICGAGGGTSLHYAAENGLVAIVPLLLAAGADIYVRDIQSRTPLDRAKEKGHANVIELLKAHERLLERGQPSLNVQSEFKRPRLVD
ncbi:MAG: ankyrin repeat domain-containing protein [Epsilonproteobacteria bacterium]|nr:ankyrin repeat domain-containing protein [Campylobacterota bacterium]